MPTPNPLTPALKAQRDSIEAVAHRAAEIADSLTDRAGDLDRKASHCARANRLRKYAEADALREQASILRRLARHAGFVDLL